MPLVSHALFAVPAIASPRLARIRQFAAEHQVRLIEVDQRVLLDAPEPFAEQATHILALADDERLAELVGLAKSLNLSLGIVPLEEQSRLQEWFLLPASLDDTIALALDDRPQAIDVLRCNDQVALGSVMLGKTPFVDSRSRIYRMRLQSTWRRLAYRLALMWSSLRSLFGIHPFAVTLTTGREQTVKTAITGLVAIENNVSNAAAKLFGSRVAVLDGKVATALIAPKSVVEYLTFVLLANFRGERQTTRLPKAISYIRSSYLRIDSRQPLTYFIDGRKHLAASIELELYPQAVRVNLSDDYQACQNGRDSKDSLKIDNLPQKDERLSMIERNLPLFSRALEEDFRELFRQLRDNARASGSFVALMMLASTVASLGLFLSSPAVIIGAMVLAPLMAPIISLAMGSLRGDRALLRQSLQTIFLGVLLALGTAALIALIIPIEKVTGEMSGRLHPNLLDLGVAVASGIAGAYAHARESVMKSMPGVAIAVALVPPLCVAGIGIGWLDLQMIAGALLLFITNLVGIALAAALTFLTLGFAPIVRAKRGLAISLLLLAVVSVPLSLSFQKIHTIWQVERVANQGPFSINGKHLSLSNVQVLLDGSRLVLRVDVSSEHGGVLYSDMQSLKGELERRLGKPLQLDVTPRMHL